MKCFINKNECVLFFFEYEEYLICMKKNVICFVKFLIFNSIIVILSKIEDVRIKLVKILNSIL